MTESFEPAGFGDEPAAKAHHVPTAPAPGDRLAALLQSAVDDQVAEQRQLSRLMADVRAALVDRAAGAEVAHAVERLESGLREGLARTDQHIAELTDRLAQAQQAVAGVRERLDAPTSDDDAATLQEVHDGLAGLRTELRVVPESIAPAVAQAVGAGLTDVGRTLERLEGAQQSTRQDLVTLQSELAEFWPQVSEYGPRLDALPQVAAALTALTDRSKALEEVPAAVSALRAQVETIRVSQQALASAPPAPTGLAGAEIANIVREGVRDATRDFVRDYLREAVQDIVTMSTRDTERRITDHVDEAVLALAQALLRRRPTLDLTPTTVSGPVQEQMAAGEPAGTPCASDDQARAGEDDQGAEPAAEQPAAEQPATEQPAAQQPAPEPRRPRRGWFRR